MVTQCKTGFFTKLARFVQRFYRLFISSVVSMGVVAHTKKGIPAAATLSTISCELSCKFFIGGIVTGLPFASVSGRAPAAGL